MDDLKQLCEAEIEDSLELENVTAVLFLGDQANAPRLKRACFDFIKYVNLHLLLVSSPSLFFVSLYSTVWIDFEQSKAWQELKDNTPTLAEEVLAAVRAEQVDDENDLVESDDEDELDESSEKGKEKEKEKEKQVMVEEVVPIVQPMIRLPPALVADD